MPKTWRTILRGLAGCLFVLLLLITAIDVGAAKVVTHPDKVKSIIAGSGLYGDIVPSALQQAGTIDTGYGDIRADNPLIEKAAVSALPAAFIQQNTEMAIDNTYQWLNGKLATPNFSINLSGVKTLFANKVASSVQARLNSLPICSLRQTLQIFASGHYDALKSNCRPYGIDPISIAEQVQASIKNGSRFLPDSSLTAANIKLGKQYLFKGKLNHAPSYYQRIKESQAILIGLLLLAAAGLILLGGSWQVGLQLVGVTLVIAGVIILILAWGFNYEVGGAVIPRLGLNGTQIPLQQDIRSILLGLEQAVDQNYWDIGSLYVVLGALAIGISKASRRMTNGLVTPSKVNKRRENPSRN